MSAPTPVDRAAIEGHLGRILGDEFQRELPASVTPQSSAGPPPREVSAGRHGQDLGGSAVATVLLWVLLGSILVAVGVFFARGFFGVSREPRLTPSEGPGSPDGPLLGAAPLEDAEVLAAQGRFAEAVHVLLLRTFRALDRNATLPGALTSREAVAALRLPGEAGEALMGLVSTVEVSWFGDAEPTRSDYARCVAAFRRLQASRVRAA